MPANTYLELYEWLLTEGEDYGLVRIGGPPTVESLLAAYRKGVFPWPATEAGVEVMAWYAPDPRAIIELDGLYVSRRLARRLRSGRFEITINRDFSGVLEGCAETRCDGFETWITEDMKKVYSELHRLGYAHSVEVWRDDALVGGVYGVALGGMFSGESMFHRETDGSKIALVGLVDHLRQSGFTLFDIQVSTPHSLRMGAIEISRDEFLNRLGRALKLNRSFSNTPTLQPNTSRGGTYELLAN